MAINIKNIFNAESRDIQSLYNATPGLGFFIPTYQRQYTWGRTNIERMLDDIKSCIERLADYNDSVTFIGTVITVANNEGVAVRKDLKNELPTKVHHVIDGQQRLTSYILILTALYSVLDEFNNIYKKEQEEKISIAFRKWINSKVSELQKTIKNSIAIEMGDDGDVDKGYNFYPKMTRAHEDSWSKYEIDAQYNSPIAFFLHKFIRTYITKKEPEFDFSTLKLDEKLKNVIENYDFLRRSLREFSCDEKLFPTNNIKSNKTMLERFLNNSADDIHESVEQEEINNCSSIIRVIMLGNFILKRVVATFVEVSDDNYAFDMFEALNTTGEPLTAFETFKPKVVEFCQDSYPDKEYHETQESKFLSITEELLNKYKNADEKHKKTTSLFQSFKIAYEGASLSGHLSEQRRYINTSFENTKDKIEFIKLISATCDFVLNVWEEQKPDLLFSVPGSSSHLKELMSRPNYHVANFCIKALKSAGHKIVCGLFSSFYYQFIKNDYSCESFDRLIEAILATTAFFVRYRSFNHGTDGIDDKYRKILSHDVYSGCIPVRTIPSLKENFKKQLFDSGRSDYGIWIRTVKSQDLYKNRKDLSKLMLILAIEKSIADTNNLGLLVDGVSSLHSYLNINSWDEFATIEHIWPQNADSNDRWAENLETEKHLNCIGNLSILPLSENSIVSNKGWEHKKIIYKILAEGNASNKQDLINTAVVSKIISLKQGSILSNVSKLHSHITAVSLTEKWDADFVEKRSENILERVWNVTEKWLS